MKKTKTRANNEVTKPQFLEPYYFPKKIKLLLGIIMGISAIIFILLDFVKVEGKSELLVYLISFVKQLAILITSIIGTEFLVSLAIEKRNRNDAFKEFFDKDFINSSVFTDMVPRDKQKNISDKYRLEHVFEDKKIVSEMIDYAQDKLCKNLEDFYYESCYYHVNCSIEKGEFRKDLKKVIQIRSIKGTVHKNKFPIISVYAEKAKDGSTRVSLPIVKIKKVSETKYRTLTFGKDYYVESKPIEETMKKKNGYDSINTFYLRDSVELTENQDFCIEANCVNYSSLDDDISSVFRVQVPCRKFAITFNAPDSYRVKPNAFGYIDHSQKAVNGEELENVKIEFDKWIFPDDGAIIEVTKK